MSQETSIDTQNRVGIEHNHSNKVKELKLKIFTISGANSFQKTLCSNFLKLVSLICLLLITLQKKIFLVTLNLISGIEMMTYHYFNKGYLDFKVLDIVKTNLDNDKEKISLDIEISEGIQYKLGKVSFDGEFGQISPNASLNDAISHKRR